MSSSSTFSSPSPVPPSDPREAAHRRRLRSLHRLYLQWNGLDTASTENDDGNDDGGSGTDEEEDEEEELEEFEYCFICDTPGELVMCDGCPRTYHTGCVTGGAAAIPEDGEWLCSRCTLFPDDRPHLRTCGPCQDGHPYGCPCKAPATRGNTGAPVSDVYDASPRHV